MKLCQVFMILLQDNLNIFFLKLTLVVLTPTAHRYCAMLCDDRLPYRPIGRNRCPDPDLPIVRIDEIPISELLRDAFSIQTVAVKLTEKNAKILILCPKLVIVKNH